MGIHRFETVEGGEVMSCIAFCFALRRGRSICLSIYLSIYLSILLGFEDADPG